MAGGAGASSSSSSSSSPAPAAAADEEKEKEEKLKTSGNIARDLSFFEMKRLVKEFMRNAKTLNAIPNMLTLAQDGDLEAGLMQSVETRLKTVSYDFANTFKAVNSQCMRAIVFQITDRILIGAHLNKLDEDDEDMDAEYMEDDEEEEEQEEEDE